jgi:hypothetical protein
VIRGLKLAIEPKPASTWGKTLANLWPPNEWADIRQQVYREADYECIICKTKNQQLHCHEVWRYDYKKGIAHLSGFECICKICHDVKHFGRSQVVYPKSYVNSLIVHWCKVNKRTRSDFAAYLDEVHEISSKRANIYWIVKVGRKTLT